MKFLAFVTAFIQFILTALGATFNMDNTSYINQTALNSQAKSITLCGEEHRDGHFAASAGAEIEYTFGTAVKFNTATIKEKGKNVTEFEIYADGKMIYRQDKIDALRYCSLDTVSAEKIKVVITESKADFVIKEIKFYYVENSIPENFAVTSYFITDRIQSPASLDASHMSVITDAIVFGSVRFDTKGNVSFEDKTINGKAVDGEEVFATAVENLRAAGGSSLKLHVNLLGPDTVTPGLSWEEGMYEKADLHALAMKDNKDVMIPQIVALLDKYDLDGVFFDYEYPLRLKDWDFYNNFIVALDAAIGNRELGIALASWGIHLSPAATAALERVEVMAYDLFDEDGWHSPFYTCSYEALNDCEKAGIPREKLELGIPFYSRPTDGAGVWVDYASEYEQLGEFGNIATGDCGHTAVDRYYNGVQMVRDKTAFAAHYGARGVMIWHYSCDTMAGSGLSLFSAMGKTIAER